MDSEGGGKIRAKRSHDQSKPYSRRKSLLGRVGDTVKDILSPSWIVDLVSSVKKKTPPHESSAPRITESHNHNGGSTPRQIDPVQRNFKTMPELMATPTLMPSYLPTGGMGGTVDNQSGAGNDHLTFTSAQLPFPHYNHVTKPIVNGGDDQSEHSEYSVSTSGCSSLMPHPDRGEYQRDVLQLNDSKLVNQARHNMTYDGTATLDGATNTTHNMSNRMVGEGSFLWSSKAKSGRAQPQPSAQSHKPSFNVSSFGTSVMTPEKSSLFGTNFGDSPYYPGKTTFGGASSHRKSKLSSPAPYEVTSRNRVEAKPRMQSNAGLTGVSSSTARLILDSLDRMSTPLKDAKKIPSYEKVTDSPLSFTPGSYRRRNSLLNRSKISEGPPVSKIASHGVASLAKNRHRPPTYEIDIEPTSHQISSSERDPSPKRGQSSRCAPVSDPGGGGRSGKVRRERGGQHYSSKNKEEEEIVEVPDLPTGFTLPVGGALPTISFGNGASMLVSQKIPVSSSHSASDSSSLTSSVKNQLVTQTRALPTFDNSSVLSSPVSFTFSSPIAQSSSHDPVQAPSKESFNFSSPIKVEADEGTNMAGAGFSTAKPSSELKTKVDSTEAAVNVGIKAANQLKSGSVMDVLGGLSKPQAAVTNGPSIIASASVLKKGSVMDILGKSGNTAGSFLPESGNGMDSSKASVNNNKMNAAVPSLSSVFQKPSGSWECDTCMVQNKADASKCVACESKRPMPKSATSVPVPTLVMQAPAGSGFGNSFKPATGSWSCDTCMIQNKADANRCVACETARPTTKPAAPTQVPETRAQTSAGFGNLFSKPIGWDCTVCLVQNKVDAVECVACKSPKPGAVSSTSTPTRSSAAPLAFTGNGFGKLGKPTGWSCTTCLVQNKQDTIKCVACDTPKPGAGPSTKISDVTPGLGSSFAAPKDGWNCDTCLVTNKAQATKCIACETPKSGAQPTTGFTTSGGFRFGSEGGFKTEKKPSGISSANFGSGSLKASNVHPVSGGFKLDGDSAAKSDSKPVFGNVTLPSSSDKTVEIFGGIKRETSEQRPANLGFKFGGESKGTSDSQPTTGGFKSSHNDKSKTDDESPHSVFGTSSNVTPASILTDNKSSGGFIFGSTTKPNSEPAKPAGGISFGQRTVDLDKPAAPTGGFSFDATVGKSISSVPVFGSSKVSSPAASASVFGATGSESSKSKDSAAAVPETKPHGTQEKHSGGLAFGSTNLSEADKISQLPAATFTFGAMKSAEEKSKPVLPASGGNFVFGASSTSDKPVVKSSTPASGTILFGSAPGTNTEQPVSKLEQSSSTATAGFSFGTPAATVSGFNFRSKGVDTVSTNKRGQDDVDEGAPAKKSVPIFGITGSSRADSGSGFKFGESKVSAAPASTMFSFSANKASGSAASTSTNVTPAAFTFGQTSAAKPEEPPSFQAPSTNFTFGSSGTSGFGGPAAPTPARNTSGVFQFSASSQPQSQATVGSAPQGGFTFGQPAPAPTPAASAPPAGGFNFAAAAGNTNFNFGGASQQNSTIQFGASAPSSGSNPFSVATAPTNPQRRTVKKAVRRVTRK